MKLEGLDHVALSVADLKRSAKWYVEVLGFARMHEAVWGEAPTFVGIGGTGAALFPKKKQGESDDGIRHVAFRAAREEFLVAQRELKERGIAFHFEDHEISHSIYFCDLDGNQLEITTYELGEARAAGESH